jgi:phosphoglycolate phosphatase
MVKIVHKNWDLDDIEGVLFDKDGTLIDSHIYWGRIIERRASAVIEYFNIDQSFFYRMFLALGYDCNEKKLLEQGPIALVSREQVIESFLRFLALENIVKADFIEISDIFTAEHKCFQQEIFNYINLLPGVIPVLEKLKEHGAKLTIVTSDSIINTEETIKYLKIEKYFDLIIGKESKKEPKHTGIPALEAIKQLGLEKEKTIAIGDAPMDIFMANNSKLKAGVGISTGQVKYEKLSEYTKYLAGSLKEIDIKK